ncbi:MAG: GNAT family N-acetyltransferase [Synechococcales bacterium]|nr:GNAT family N-acetyltransferase [Synechococcales bacterium]
MGLQIPVQDIAIRSVEAADFDWCANLIFAAGPGLFSYVFASTADKALATLREAFSAPRHAFSHDHVQLLEVCDQPAGLVLGYSGAVKHRAEEQIQGIMAHILPINRVPRILVNLADLSRIRQDVASEDYYVLSLGIVPEFRNRGLGTALLQDTEMTARELGCRTLCLDVAYSNTRAIRFFERLGYEIACSKTSHRFSNMTDAGGLHRMEKIL